MKRLSDNKEVLDIIYCYLLQWNARNKKEYMSRMFGKDKLDDLTLPEFKMLFLYATSEDYNAL